MSAEKKSVSKNPSARKTDVLYSSGAANKTTKTLVPKKSSAARIEAVSVKHERLLQRQQQLLQLMRKGGDSQLTTTVAGKINASRTQEIAKSVGIWTASGKLATSYKK